MTPAPDVSVFAAPALEPHVRASTMEMSLPAPQAIPPVHAQAEGPQGDTPTAPEGASAMVNVDPTEFEHAPYAVEHAPARTVEIPMPPPTLGERRIQQISFSADAGSTLPDVSSAPPPVSVYAGTETDASQSITLELPSVTMPDLSSPSPQVSFYDPAESQSYNTLIETGERTEWSEVTAPPPAYTDESPVPQRETPRASTLELSVYGAPNTEPDAGSTPPEFSRHEPLAQPELDSPPPGFSLYDPLSLQPRQHSKPGPAAFDYLEATLEEPAATLEAFNELSGESSQVQEAAPPIELESVLHEETQTQEPPPPKPDLHSPPRNLSVFGAPPANQFWAAPTGPVTDKVIPSTTPSDLESTYRFDAPPPAPSTNASVQTPYATPAESDAPTAVPAQQTNPHQNAIQAILSPTNMRGKSRSVPLQNASGQNIEVDYDGDLDALDLEEEEEEEEEEALTEGEVPELVQFPPDPYPQDEEEQSGSQGKKKKRPPLPQHPNPDEVYFQDNAEKKKTAIFKLPQTGIVTSSRGTVELLVHKGGRLFRPHYNPVGILLRVDVSDGFSFVREEKDLTHWEMTDHSGNPLDEDSIQNVAFDKKGNLWYETAAGRKTKFLVDGGVEVTEPNGEETKYT